MLSFSSTELFAALLLQKNERFDISYGECEHCEACDSFATRGVM